MPVSRPKSTLRNSSREKIRPMKCLLLPYFSGNSSDSHDSEIEALDDPEELWNIVLTRGGQAAKFVASLVREVLLLGSLRSRSYDSIPPDGSSNRGLEK